MSESKLTDEPSGDGSAIPRRLFRAEAVEYFDDIISPRSGFQALGNSRVLAVLWLVFLIDLAGVIFIARGIVLLLR